MGELMRARLRLVTVLTITAIATFLATLGVSSAQADTVAPYRGADGNTAQISTEKGGYIVIAAQLGSKGANKTCKAAAQPANGNEGRGIYGQDFRFDGFGNGRVRLGPLGNGQWSLLVFCSDSTIGYIFAPTTPYQGLVIVTLDGGSTVAPPARPSLALPSPQDLKAQSLNDTCNSIVGGLTGGYITDPVTGGIGIIVRYFCGVFGDPKTRQEQFCRAVEDAAFGAIPFVNVQQLDRLFGNPETYCR